MQTKRGERDDFVFNELSQKAALELSLPNQSGELSRIAQNFELESATATRAVYVLNTDEGLQIRRIYDLAGDESEQPYVIQHRTQVLNTGAESVQLSDLYFNLGTVTTIASNALPSYLNVGYFNGDVVEFTAVDDLTGSSGILGFGAKQPQAKISLSNRMEWTSVNNQFFTAILSADSPGKQLTILPERSTLMQTCPIPPSKPVSAMLWDQSHLVDRVNLTAVTLWAPRNLSGYKL